MQSCNRKMNLFARIVVLNIFYMTYQLDMISHYSQNFAYLFVKISYNVMKNQWFSKLAEDEGMLDVMLLFFYLILSYVLFVFRTNSSAFNFPPFLQGITSLFCCHVF